MHSIVVAKGANNQEKMHSRASGNQTQGAGWKEEARFVTAKVEVVESM